MASLILLVGIGIFIYFDFKKKMKKIIEKIDF